MRDREDCLFPDFAELLEKYDSFDIQMVRWFIEDQEIYFSDEEFGNLYFGLFSSRELEYIEIQLFLRESKVSENLGLKLISSIAIILPGVWFYCICFFLVFFSIVVFIESIHLLSYLREYHEHLFSEGILGILPEEILREISNLES